MIIKIGILAYSCVNDTNKNTNKFFEQRRASEDGYGHKVTLVIDFDFADLDDDTTRSGGNTAYMSPHA